MVIVNVAIIFVDGIFVYVDDNLAFVDGILVFYYGNVCGLYCIQNCIPIAALHMELRPSQLEAILK
jgi:hypothetical protein